MTNNLRNYFNSGDKQFRCSILKLFCIHISPRPPCLCSCYGLAQLVWRYLGTGFQEAYSLDISLQTGFSICISIHAAVCITALGCLQGLLQGSQHRLTQCTRGRPLIWAAHFSIKPLGLPDVVRENRTREHAVTEDIVRDGLVVVTMEATQQWSGSGRWDSTFTAQALQSL